MFRKMRRSKQELTKEECIEILKKNREAYFLCREKKAILMECR